MSKIEQAKAYTGRDLESIFFRPIINGPGMQELGIKMMYNMPTPTTLHYWGRSGDVLQKFTTTGWSGGVKSQKYQKTIEMQRVKAEMGYSAQDYFNRVYELISASAEANMDDLSGTQLEEAETALFKDAIAESIRKTMWYGDTTRTSNYITFDGFLKRISADVTAGETQIVTKTITTITTAADAEKLLKEVWTKASASLKGLKNQGELVYFVSSDIYALYEDALDDVQLESAYLAKQQGRPGLLYKGIPVIDLQLGTDTPTNMPSSLVLLTDRRNLAMAVNTSDLPGSEVRMWYNPDQMENRQRAVFLAGCDYLLPELISYAANKM